LFNLKRLQKIITEPALEAHTYNPSYSGGKDQEDQGSPRQLVRDSISKKPIMKKGLMEWLK
jgi:hypothetical protein